MAQVTLEETIGQIVGVIREGFDGPPEEWSYFTDNSSEAGMFGTLADITAEQASEKIGKSSIAAHVYHTVFSLEAAAVWIRGEQKKFDWPQSWSVTEIDEAGWKKMIEDMRAKYEDLVRAVAENCSANILTMGGAIGTAAHIAYHLGAIRQKIQML